MMQSLYLAYRYIRFNKVKSLVLIAAVTLMVFLPLSVQMLVTESEKQLMLRAGTTPLVIGKKGSSLDLVMSTLYFQSSPPEQMEYREVQRVDDSELAYAIPVYHRFQARGYPVIGTSLEYFDFRKLEIGKGSVFGFLGECVLGAEAAESLGLGPGDSLITSPESLFDLAGVYPLKMKVRGVLKPSYSRDDEAVFVDIKTAWVIQGLAHGHQNLAEVTDSRSVLKKEGNLYTASSKLYHYNEVTPENMRSFHFHGDTSNFPVTAVIAVPKDGKAKTLLMGRYLSPEQKHQIVQPDTVIEGLIQTIFKIKKVLDTVFILVSAATVLLIILILVLSLRLRREEIDTIFKMGCSRLKIAQLLAFEIGILLSVSAGLTGLLVFISTLFQDRFIQMLIA